MIMRSCLRLFYGWIELECWFGTSFVRVEEWYIMVKRITRDPQTWVCIFSPPFTSHVTLNKLNTGDLSFFKFHYVGVHYDDSTGVFWEANERMCIRLCVLLGSWQIEYLLGIIISFMSGHYYDVLLTLGSSERTAVIRNSWKKGLLKD